MKILKILFLVAMLAIILLTATACTTTRLDAADCVRIHIRANSNDDSDQAVKLLVRDRVVEYLTPLLAECETVSDARVVITANIRPMSTAANACLAENGFSYTAKIRLSREKFPYREYLGFSFPSGEYDALIIELGTGDGDNWWCVCFPPLCFVPDDDSQEFGYKSKIAEIIQKYRGN